jgi:elongation factor Ts
MAITAKMIKDIREATGAGMSDCKAALDEAEKTHTSEKELMELAVEILRKKGIAKAAKRLDRETSEGRVVFKQDAHNFAMLSVTCETDFVSRNENFEKLAKRIIDHAFNAKLNTLEEFLNSKLDGQVVAEFLAEQTGSIGEKIEIKHYIYKSSTNFIQAYVHHNYKIGTFVELKTSSSSAPAIVTFAKDVAMHIAAMKPIALDKTQVSQDVINKEIEIAKEVLRNEGKKEEMLEKIAQGKIARFFKDSCLLEQSFVKSEAGKSVEECGKDLAKSLNTELSFVSMIRFSIGE